MAELRIGTNSFTATGWETSFYRSGMKPRDFLTYYAARFYTVEIGIFVCDGKIVAMLTSNFVAAVRRIASKLQWEDVPVKSFNEQFVISETSKIHLQLIELRI